MNFLENVGLKTIGKVLDIHANLFYWMNVRVENELIGLKLVPKLNLSSPQLLVIGISN